MRRMGSGSLWMKWMKAIIFSSQMFVFVNRSSTTDFEVGRRLRRGDPLSPFLYVIIDEGLADLVKKASNAEDFRGFNVNG